MLFGHLKLNPESFMHMIHRVLNSFSIDTTVKCTLQYLGNITTDGLIIMMHGRYKKMFYYNMYTELILFIAFFIMAKYIYSNY